MDGVDKVGVINKMGGGLKRVKSGEKYEICVKGVPNGMLYALRLQETL